MAQELTIAASLAFAKGNVASISRSLATGSKFNVSGSRYVEGVKSATTSAVAIDLGEMAGTLGWYFFRNLDATNYIEILDSSAGAAIIKLKPGECAIGRFPAAITAPAAKANTASAQLEYLFIED
jgi:hypothetical protein